MDSLDKEIDDLKKAIDYIRMRINVLKGRTPLDFGQSEPKQVDWLDEPIEEFMERWNVDTMAEANAKYYAQKAKEEGKPLGELDDDGIPL
jgi:hypothetical protein